MTDPRPNRALEDSSPEDERVQSSSSSSTATSLTVARRSEASTRASLFVAALIKFIVTTNKADLKVCR